MNWAESPHESGLALDELVGLYGVVLSNDDLPSALAELCRTSVRVIPAADGASITTFPEGRPQAIASDDWARRFDELQYAEQEGPCLDAYRTGNAFRVRDLAAEFRWPSYVPRAVELGARSMVSLPMSAQGSIIGALNLYARDVDAFSAEAASVAAILAAHAGMASQVAAALFGNRQLADQLAEALQSRGVIEQAKGILMGARGCSADEAFDMLVHLSQKSHRKLRDVASALVDEATTGSAGSSDKFRDLLNSSGTNE
jgi:GAF domain-containing protein